MGWLQRRPGQGGVRCRQGVLCGTQGWVWGVRCTAKLGCVASIVVGSVTAAMTTEGAVVGVGASAADLLTGDSTDGAAGVRAATGPQLSGRCILGWVVDTQRVGGCSLCKCARYHHLTCCCCCCCRRRRLLLMPPLRRCWQPCSRWRRPGRQSCSACRCACSASFFLQLEGLLCADGQTWCLRFSQPRELCWHAVTCGWLVAAAAAAAGQ